MITGSYFYATLLYLFTMASSNFAARLHNRPDRLDLRRALRHNLTPAEATLWRALQGSKLSGFKFRRQQSIGPYIVDFYCPAARLVIELDGAAHFTATGSANDDERTAFLSANGLHVLRFENQQVWGPFDTVLATILAVCQERATLPP